MSYVLLILLLFLLLVYFYLKNEDAKNQFNINQDFGKKQKDKLSAVQRDAIINDKIKFKRLSFYSYWLSGIASFVFGIYGINKIINGELDVKLLTDFIGIAGGTLLTISLKQLYDKCKRDIDKLLD